MFSCGSSLHFVSYLTDSILDKKPILCNNTATHQQHNSNTMDNDKQMAPPMHFRVPRELRDEFLALCEVNQIPMSVALRALMVSAIENAKNGTRMPPLFSRPAPTIIKA